MKIVSWNCAGVFREDFKIIRKEEDPDIYVIQECENPKKEGKEYEEYSKFAGEETEKDYFWVGNERGDKGLGIFKKPGITLKKLPINGKNKHFIAVEVEDSFNLLAVWAMDKDKEKGLNPYVEMIHDFFDENPHLFNKKLIMCGDFNSSSVFDKKHKAKDNRGKPKDHTHLNEKLNSVGLYSVYHRKSSENSGEESRYTFFQARHLNVPFHLDYFYANEKIIEKTELLHFWKRKLDDNLPNKFKILDKWDWISLSDHLPLVFEFDEKKFF